MHGGVFVVFWHDFEVIFLPYNKTHCVLLHCRANLVGGTNRVAAILVRRPICTSSDWCGDLFVPHLIGAAHNLHQSDEVQIGGRTDQMRYK